MKNLHDPVRVTEIEARLLSLPSDAPRQWGKMTLPQAMAHMSIGFESALGDVLIKRVFIGRLIGGFVKRMVFADDAPMRRDSPTAPEFIVTNAPDLERERARLLGLLHRFADGGPAACTTHPHGFFGPLTPDEWAILMYKHMDHHLRQFGA
ncbi:MAG: DUF1569 domain-containing protein [Gemmatimonadota bacterium]